MSMRLENFTDKDIEMLQWYLSRSLLKCSDCKGYGNPIAEEADAGNKWAIKALQAKDKFMKIKTKRQTKSFVLGCNIASLVV